MADDREFLKHSLRLLAEKVREGQAPGAHPSVEGLVAYHAGELSDGEAREIQRHLGICHECPELVLALDGFTDRSAGKPGISPAEIDSAWDDLRQRLAAEGWFEGGAKRSSRSWAPLSSPQRRLITAVAVVVLAFLGTYLVLADRYPRIVDQPEAGASTSDLLPATRGAVQEIAGPSTAGHFYLVMAPEGPQPYPEYQVELRTAGEPGKVWWHSRWHPKSDTAELFLRIPRGFLPAGKYQVKLQGLAGGRPVRESVDERSFRLSYP